ncbi:AAA family ATPase [Flavobacterium sp. XS2P24]|uniref:AAA family ATPase n=1 Tax=Flavobacterium sp. XS2P24 TaxID=3041249 RepID=UPI0024A94B28|nr:AAA family ATPase [Flavobacterium sp. XS2P24]MDI6048691.1 AAA family ATPase [Flavobacterium sp. XS2P24]
MRIKLQNIGIIEEADINVDGITLIAGQNDSGKSTIGKVLYSIVKGFNLNENIFYENKNRIVSYYYQDILKELKKNWNEDISEYQTKEINDIWINQIDMLVSKDPIPDEIKKSILDKISRLKKQFKSKYNTIEQKQDEIERWISTETSTLYNIFNTPKKEFKIEIEDLLGSTIIEDRYKNINTEYIFLSLDKNLETYYKEAYYIESPLIIDESLQRFVGKDNFQSYSRSRQEELAKSLSNPIQVNTLDYSNIYNKVSEIINGEITIDLLDGVRYKKNNQDIAIKNTAVGIKSFGIIQLLLKNNRLNNRTLLIIDEPEVHLHPIWQVKFAEILVILSKDFDIPMVLTSHSPYFIEALEGFVKKYKYEKSTNFYFAEKNEDGLSSKIIDVTKDITPILSSISGAFYKIQDINDED